MGELAVLRHPSAQWALGGLARTLEALSSPHHQVAVLTYHRVEPAPPGETTPSSLSVAPEAFREQMEVVVRRANPVTMDAVLDAFAGHAPLPPRAVLVTFDDAYDCVRQHAWPTLQALGIPATMFVPTRYPDSGLTFWWDRLHRAVAVATSDVTVLGTPQSLTSAADRRRLFTAIRTRLLLMPHDEAMELVDRLVGRLESTCSSQEEPVPLASVSSWSDLRSMAVQGLTLGAHTRTHPYLTTVDPDRLEEELVGSLAELRLFAGGHVRPVFAYPGGVHDPAVAGAVGRAGFKLGFTTDRGVVNVDDADPLLLTRINVGHRTAANTVRVQLHPITHRVHRATARRRVTGIERGRSTWN